MAIRAATGCERCDTAPWPGVSPAWQLVDVPGTPAWMRGLQVRRCTACGRIWSTPYDQYDGVYYSAIEPFSPPIADLFVAGAGLPALFAFINAERCSNAMVTVAQAFLLRASYDMGAALAGLARCMSPDSTGEQLFRMLILVEAAFVGDSGLAAWKRRHTNEAPRLAAEELARLRAALDEVPADGPLAELRRRIERWGPRLTR